MGILEFESVHSIGHTISKGWWVNGHNKILQKGGGSEDMDTLAKLLHNERIARGTSLRKMAKEIGLSKSYLAYLEKGRSKKPSIEVLEKISRYTGKNMTEIINIIKCNG